MQDEKDKDRQPAPREKMPEREPVLTGGETTGATDPAAQAADSASEGRTGKEGNANETLGIP